MNRPPEAARRLLAYDTPDHTHLVGIDFEGTKAVYYPCGADGVIIVGFDSDGLADGSPVMGPFDGRWGFAAWIETMATYWGWLYPRYRR